MTPAIEISHLTKTFRGKRGARVAALQDLSLAIDRGEVFGFLGPNGAGKSTTIKILMGLLAPTSGEARIFGRSAREPEARREVGYLPENPAFYDYLDAEEYLAMVGRIYRMEPERLRQSSETVLRRLDLWEARKRPMRGYSKGMVQRVGLAQALLHDPQLFILDEPMSGLDPIGRALVKEIILELKSRGKSIFFSTHIISDVESICDRVAIINRGTLCRVDAVQQTLRESISGYLIVYQKDGCVHEAQIARGQLEAFMQESLQQRYRIDLIEPQRKHLQEIFLETVQQDAP